MTNMPVIVQTAYATPTFNTTLSSSVCDNQCVVKKEQKKTHIHTSTRLYESTKKPGNMPDWCVNKPVHRVFTIVERGLKAPVYQIGTKIKSSRYIRTYYITSTSSANALPPRSTTQYQRGTCPLLYLTIHSFRYAPVSYHAYTMR